MVDGSMLLSLTEDDILPLAGLEEKSALKILELISQLEPVGMNTNGSPASLL